MPSKRNKFEARALFVQFKAHWKASENCVHFPQKFKKAGTLSGIGTGKLVAATAGAIIEIILLRMMHFRVYMTLTE